MARRTWLPALAAAAIATPGAALADPTPAGAPAAPALKPDLTALAKLVGDWDCKGTFASGKPIASTLHLAPTLNGTWLAGQQDDRPPNMFHASLMWGTDPQTHQLVGWMFDSSGAMRTFVSGGWQNGKLTWTRSDVPPDTANDRFVYELPSSNELHVAWQVQPARKDWTTGDTLTCQRTK